MKNSYYKSISNFKIVTAEQELDLIRRAKKGEKKAIDSLVLSNMRLVIKFARKFSKDSEISEDLISEGVFGIIRSIESFDETKKFRFMTYAAGWIKHYMMKFYMKNQTIFKIPGYQNNSVLYFRIRKFEQQFLKNFNRTPTLKEISSQLNISERLTFDLQRMFQKRVSTVRIDTGEELDIFEIIKDDTVNSQDINLDLDNSMKKLSKFISSKNLTEQERRILKSSFGFDGLGAHNLKEISETERVSRERIRQIKAKALMKLRNKYLESLIQIHDSLKREYLEKY